MSITSLSGRVSKNLVTLSIACLLVAGCIDVGLSDHNTAHEPIGEHAHHEEAADAAMAMDHDMHETYEVPAGQPAPAITKLEVTPDSKSGYNVHVQTENFRFAPEHASGQHEEGEGHAHLYVDGVKINRLYGEWYYLDLPQGEHTVTVSLNTNDHRTYAQGGTAASAEVTLAAK